jgi:hypothetical protein
LPSCFQFSHPESDDAVEPASTPSDRIDTSPAGAHPQQGFFVLRSASLGFPRFLILAVIAVRLLTTGDVGQPPTPFAAHIERRYPSVVELPGGAPYGLRYNLYLRWCREHCLPSNYAQTDCNGLRGERGFYNRFYLRTRKLAPASNGRGGVA